MTSPDTQTTFIVDTTTTGIIHSDITSYGNNATGEHHAEIYSPVTKGTLPTIIFVGILSVIGVVGNIHVLVVFLFKLRTKSTYRIYVISLALIDLCVSMFHMPGEILDLYYPYDFWSSVTCRLFRFNNFSLATSSVLVLIVVAIDRYKRVCHTMKRQWSVSTSRKLVVGCVLFGMIVASPSFVLFGIRTVKIDHDDQAATCFINDDYKDSIFVVLWIGAVYFMFIIGGIILIFTYVSIGYNIRKQTISRAYLTKSKEINTHRSPNCTTPMHNRPNTSEILPNTQIGNGFILDEQKKKIKHSINQAINDNGIVDHLQQTSVGADDRNIPKKIGHCELSYIHRNIKGISSFSLNENHDANRHQIGSNMRRFNSVDSTLTSNSGTPSKPSVSESNRTTKIVCVITIVFIVSYVPYLTFGIILGLYPEFKMFLTELELALYRLAMRLSLVNNVCNCFIYGILDKRFMSLCKEMYRCCRNSRKNCTESVVATKANYNNGFI